MENKEVLLNYSYFEKVVTFWRNKKAEAIASGNKEDELIASCYVDAFQSVLASHDLPMIPKPGV